MDCRYSSQVRDLGFILVPGSALGGGPGQGQADLEKNQPSLPVNPANCFFTASKLDRV